LTDPALWNSIHNRLSLSVGLSSLSRSLIVFLYES
jgi:hypothetical protein